MRHVIVNLHGLGTPAHPLDPGEDRYWVAADLLQEAVDQAQAAKDKVQVEFTFDDGNLSDLTLGAPILNAAGMRGIFFVLADRIDTPHYLGSADIAELLRMGHRVETHGAAHVDWTAQTPEGLTREIEDARDRIASVTGRPVTQAAIPFGRYNARVLRHLRQAGLTRVYSSDGGDARANPWPVPRTSLTHDMTAKDITALLQGQEPLKTTLRRRLAMAVKKRI